MQFANYLKQNLWAARDKAMPGSFGVGFIFAVVRVLSKEELRLFQATFLFIQMVEQTLVQILLAKFLPAREENNWAIPTSFLLSYFAFLFSTLACLLGAPRLAALLNAPQLQTCSH